jgi:hypothetical protein
VGLLGEGEEALARLVGVGGEAKGTPEGEDRALRFVVEIFEERGNGALRGKCLNTFAAERDEASEAGGGEDPIGDVGAPFVVGAVEFGFEDGVKGEREIAAGEGPFRAATEPFPVAGRMTESAGATQDFVAPGRLAVLFVAGDEGVYGVGVIGERFDGAAKVFDGARAFRNRFAKLGRSEPGIDGGRRRDPRGALGIAVTGDFPVGGEGDEGGRFGFEADGGEHALQRRIAEQGERVVAVPGAGGPGSGAEGERRPNFLVFDAPDAASREACRFANVADGREQKRELFGDDHVPLERQRAPKGVDGRRRIAQFS